MYVAIAHNYTYTHMEYPYAYDASYWPIHVQDIPYTHGTSHTHMGQNIYIMCDVEVIVVYLHRAGNNGVELYLTVGKIFAKF